MPTDPPPSAAGDELVSAVLDGEATAGERAQVEADPVLRARLHQFQQVADAIALAPSPLDVRRAEPMVATALATVDADEVVSAVMDGQATGEERAWVEGDAARSARLAQFRAGAALVAGAPAPLGEDDRRRLVAVVPLAGRRDRTAGRRPPMGLVAAAVVAVLVVAVGLIVAGNDSTTTDQAVRPGRDAATDGGTAARGEAPAEPEAEAPDQAGPGAAGADSADVTDLGSFPDADDLREGLDRLDPETLALSDAIGPDPQPPPRLTQLQVDRCDQATRGKDPALAGAPTAAATAVVAGDDVLVFSYPFGAGGLIRLYAVQVDTCEVVLAIQL